MNTMDASRHQRALGDLRGAAGANARRGSVRRPLRGAARQSAAAEVWVGRLERTADVVLGARAAERDALLGAQGTPPLIMQPRTVNALVVVMALCDSLLVATALQAAYRSTPLGAMIVSAGIGVALVVLGKMAGERLASFHRLDDQGARWGVLAGLMVTMVAIASVGLTLLRIAPTWSWPFLVLAVPSGSVALTWFTHNPRRVELARRERRRRKAERRAHRADRRVVRHLALHDERRSTVEQRYRSRLGGAFRRAISDGAVAGADFELHRRHLDTFVHDNIPASGVPPKVRARRDRVWALLGGAPPDRAGDTQLHLVLDQPSAQEATR